MKKVVSLILVFIMLCSTFAVSQITSYAVTISGKCGDNITYTLDYSSGLLTIRGSGAMQNYGFNESPFYSMSTVKTITIQDGITQIGSYMFEDCYNLTDIYIPQSIISIGYDAFRDCRSLSSILIPNSIQLIDSGTFANCVNLKSVKMSNTVTEIRNWAFDGCKSLTSIKIPDSVTYIDQGAFFGCSGLTNITIPNGVFCIGSDAFYGCKSLTSIKIPDSVIQIGEYAFYECIGLTSVTIPNSVKIIEDHAFENCKNLEKVNCYCGLNTGESVFSGCPKLNKALMHKYELSRKKATLSKDGYTISRCSVCNNVQKKTILYYPKTFKLSTKIYTYNGKAKTPKVTVFDSKGKQIPSSNYTVKYSNNKNVGVATVYVVFKGNYSETKKLQFTIIPASTAIQKANSPVKTGVYVQWKKVGNITGYEVQLSDSSSFVTGKRNRSTKNYIKLKKLKSKKTYYVRIRTYKIVNGKLYYSLWSKTSKVKIK